MVVGFAIRVIGTGRMFLAKSQERRSFIVDGCIGGQRRFGEGEYESDEGVEQLSRPKEQQVSPSHCSSD